MKHFFAGVATCLTVLAGAYFAIHHRPSKKFKDVQVPHAVKADTCIRLFRYAGARISVHNFKVLRVMSEHHALAVEELPACVDSTASPLAAIFVSDVPDAYRVGQVLTISRGERIKQIGIYRADSSLIQHALPVVKFIKD